MSSTNFRQANECGIVAGCSDMFPTLHCSCWIYLTWNLDSFPGLPRFFRSLVSIDNNTRMWKGALPHPCIIVNGNRKEQIKWGRPGNEATWNLICP